MKVLAVASEVFPLVKTGGLADVMGALPPALAQQGLEIRTLLPGYPAVLAALGAAETVYAMPSLHGGAARVLAGVAAGLELFVLDGATFVRPARQPVYGPGPAGLAGQPNAFRRTGAGGGRHRARRHSRLGARHRALPRLADRVGPRPIWPSQAARGPAP